MVDPRHGGRQPADRPGRVGDPHASKGEDRARPGPSRPPWSFSLRFPRVVPSSPGRRAPPLVTPRYDRPSLTPADYAKARRLLLRGDPVIAALIKQHGACGLAAAQRGDHFSALVRAITNQQLSTKAAATIYRRLTELIPRHPDAGGLDAVSDEQLRGVGYSRQKIGYLRDLCRHVQEHQLDLDTSTIAGRRGRDHQLTQIKGIGRWSAEMFLMFRLHRPDVLPVGDLGIVNAIQRQYRLRKRPTPDRIRKLGETWKPYRSVACWYLWRSLDNEP